MEMLGEAMVGEASATGQRDSTPLSAADAVGLNRRKGGRAGSVGVGWMVAGWVVLCILATLSCREEAPGPEKGEAAATSRGTAAVRQEADGFLPPDISGCTHVEIQFESSALEYLPYGRRIRRYLLSSDETEHLKSLKSVVWNDPEGIGILKERVESATYYGPHMPVIAVRGALVVTCYDHGKRLTSFLAKAGFLDFGEHVFENKYGVWAGSKPVIPELEPYRLRLDCALRLIGYSSKGQLDLRRIGDHPTASEWRSAFEPRSVDPSRAAETKCQYAMNSRCEPNSPEDMVLLFETKVGGSYYGGPELFTFNNHEPRGGCVLLNDFAAEGLDRPTVKFIHTEEELHALRWR